MRYLLICMALVAAGCTADTTTFSSTGSINQSPSDDFVDPDTGLPPTDDGSNGGSGEATPPPADVVVVEPPPTDSGGGETAAPPTDYTGGGETPPTNGGGEEPGGGEGPGEETEWVRACARHAEQVPRCENRHHGNGRSAPAAQGDELVLENIRGKTEVGYVKRLIRMMNVHGKTLVNAGSAGPVMEVRGHLCLSARSIASVSHGRGHTVLHAEEIGSIESHSGRVDVYGAHVGSISAINGRVCLHDGATVGTVDVGPSGHVGECE